ncbi:S8 family peptidase [Nesterenkonia sp. AY15]|uniref:S8 family peptidase n=1 Tax=Nesterenkonia sp. AY15 TaxID=2901139 RepID=UPI001F4D0112
MIQTDGPANLGQVKTLVSQALGHSGQVQRFGQHRPQLPVDLGDLPGRLRITGKVRDHVDVRNMFPGAVARDRKFKLADFVILTLPMTRSMVMKLASPEQSTLFEIAYRLKERCDFVRVEPELFYKKWRVTTSPEPAPPPPTPSPGGYEPPTFVGFSSGGSRSPSDGTDDHAWSLRSINWPTTNHGGLGVTVGQVDTGDRDHSELVDVYSQGGINVLTGSEDTTDPLTGPFPGHGVATASVLASRGGISTTTGSGVGTTGPDPTVDANHEVTGVANQVRVIPVRATDSVIIVSNINIAEGIWHCIQQDVDIITVSLGGYANQYLERVVSFAVFSNIIVVAAGGQISPFVPAPALYRDCIAATGSTVNKTRWGNASLGLSLDIAAPAEHVWVADFDAQEEAVRRSQGTSFASPAVAGVAALWLGRHGKQSLIEHYAGQRKLAEVFRHVARKTAQSEGWNTLLAGAGIIDAAAVLGSVLPLPIIVPERDWSNYDITSERDILRGMLGNPSESDLESVLGKFFDTTTLDIERRFVDFGSELLTLFFDSTDAVWGLQRAVQAEADQRREDAEEAVQEVVDAVVDSCSDAIATVMGWFD